MTAKLINGKQISLGLYEAMLEQVKILQEKHHITPGLAVILVGNNPASEIYVRNKIKYTKQMNMNSFEFIIPHEITQKNLIAKIEHLNNNPKIHGILVQLPLPEHIDEKAIISAINPSKDVDGFHPINVGKLVTNQPGFVPCTPTGCLKLIKSVVSDITGMHALVIGRSNIVGKPIAHLLLNENATVTIAHSKTKNLENLAKQADIVVAAVGIPNFVKAEWIKPKAIVIDVGINRIDTELGTKIVGDVDFINVKEVAGYITPVPGSVGPMTIACLLNNTIKAAFKSKDIYSSPFTL